MFDLPRDTLLFNLDETVFGRNVRSARRGAAGGPSGMTCDHLRPLLGGPRDLHKFFLVAKKLSQGEIPRTIVQIIKLGCMTALRKKDGGVRGTVVGEVIRRLKLPRRRSNTLYPLVQGVNACHTLCKLFVSWMRMRQRHPSTGSALATPYPVV